MPFDDAVQQDKGNRKAGIELYHSGAEGSEVRQGDRNFWAFEKGK